jgi:hypothetical protein
MQQYRLMEKEAEKAMMVLDEESGKLLKYKDLIPHPRYKKQWSISAADKFGRLAQGVGGRIKKPTDTIRFIHKHQVPKDRKKDVTYGAVSPVQSGKRKQIRTEQDSQQEETKSTTQAK